jgi:cytochrome c553
VPACAHCHEGDRADAYPVLHHQFADYLELQLELFREDRRGGAPFSALMRLPAHGLRDDEARAVSA